MVDTLLFAPACQNLYGRLNIKKTNSFSLNLGLAYIASFLKKNGCEVRLIDMQISNYSTQDIKQIIKHENPSFVGITCDTPLIAEAKKLAQIIKSSKPKVKIVLGGYHVTVFPKEILKNKNIDIVVIGEGEYTFLELVKGFSLKNIKGIAYRKDGKIIINSPGPLIKDLDSLPFPAYYLVDVEEYNGPMFYEKRTWGIVGSRGCPYNCIFCASHIVHKKVRLRSPKNIVDEIEHLYKKYGIKSFVFFDELLTIYKQRATAICKEIKKRNLIISWFFSPRVDTVDENLLKLIKEAGCEMINYGIESGDQKILSFIQKNITLKQIEDGVNMAHRVGLKVAGLFMLGHPYETEETIKKTINLAKKLPLHIALFPIVVPFPGTKLWTLAKKRKGIKLITKDYSKFKMYESPVIELPSISAEKLIKYQKKAYRDFYFRPTYMLRRLSKASVKSIWNDVKKALTLLSFIKQ